MNRPRKDRNKLGNRIMRKARWRRLVTVFSGIIVFATVYMLILPAITLEQQQVSTHMPGLDLQGRYRSESEESLTEEAITEGEGDFELSVFADQKTADDPEINADIIDGANLNELSAEDLIEDDDLFDDELYIEETIPEEKQEKLTIGGEVVSEVREETGTETETEAYPLSGNDALIEIITEVTTEAKSEGVPTEGMPETETEAVTEKVTEKVTEAVKETEAVTESLTEALTESGTEAVTETESETEAVTESETEELEAVTESETEELEALTESETELPEPDMPAQSFDVDTEQGHVHVEADEGAFQAGTQIHVQIVNDDETISSITDAAEQDGKAMVQRVFALDITFTDANGQEVQPALPIRVSMTDSQAAPEVEESAQAPVLVHVDHEGEATLLDSNEVQLDVKPDDDREGLNIGFDAESFSIYAVAYTVEFRTVDGGTFTVLGGRSVQLSELLEKFSEEGQPFSADSIRKLTLGEETAEITEGEGKAGSPAMTDIAVANDADESNAEESVADENDAKESNADENAAKENSADESDDKIGNTAESNTAESNAAESNAAESNIEINDAKEETAEGLLLRSGLFEIYTYGKNDYQIRINADNAQESVAGEKQTLSITFSDGRILEILIAATGTPEVSDNGVTISTLDGTYLPDEAQASADLVEENEGAAAAKEAVEEFFTTTLDDRTKYQVFDISLEGVNTEEYSDGFHVSVRLPEEVQGRDFRLYHIHEGEDPVDITDTLQLDYCDGRSHSGETTDTFAGEQAADLDYDSSPENETFENYTETVEEGISEVASGEDSVASGSAAGPEEDATINGFSFVTPNFSDFVLTYTVDFHWEVNGKQYLLSLPGGGFVSFEALMEIMGVANKDTMADEQDMISDDQTDADSDKQADAGTEVIQTEGMLTVNDIPVSEETKAFVEDVESLEFSSPELVWVGKVDMDSTVGQLKDANVLVCQYSAELSEEQITKINAQTVEAGDWALISVQPFRSEETLTVTMKNGDQFVVRVTDAQDPSVYIDQKVIIYDNEENRALVATDNTWDGYRDRFPSIPLAEAEGNEAAHWTVEKHNNNYYLKANNNKYFTINNNTVGLVDNWGVATRLTIQAGSAPDYRIYAVGNYDAQVLTYEPNGVNDGFFSAPGGTYTRPSEDHRWHAIKIVEDRPDRAGDWLLYFDDDFSNDPNDNDNKEITIYVGETISLRPYNKWEWKEGSVDVQTAHWNIGGKDNNYWNQIDSNDANGDHYDSWDDGGTGGTAGFHWTAYVKKDDQLVTHYWAVQGQATQPGDYVLTNTKNGRTITVHVVEGTPEPPKTINNIANIKVNLFDYDNGGELDVGLVDGQTNKNLANNGNFKNESVNQMGGSDHFYFLSSGGGNNNNESWNSYTKDAANPGIVESTLDANGYPKLNHGNHTSLEYLFDTSQASQRWHGGSGGDGMIAYPDVVGMFQKDNDGYYYYNSNTNFFYYDTATGTSKLYEHTYTQNSSADKGSLANDKPIGFFPFHEYNSTENLYVNQNADLNHHVGMSMEVEFMLPKDRKDDYGQPIKFDFSGDDDLWVFVEWEDDNGQKQSKLLLDLGGVHQPIHGDIDFTNGENTAFMDTNKPYTLKVFYLERGGCDSNCSIRFNLPIIQDLVVAKKLTGLTEAEKNNYKNQEFTYELIVNNELYTYPSTNKYVKAIIRDANGDNVTPDDFKIINGQFKLKDGQTLTITYLDRSDTFVVAEENTPNMENFEIPNAERFYFRPHDASQYEEEITLTESYTQGTTPSIKEWSTPNGGPDNPPYTLEDTEKVTFTNTLKEKNLEVEKKWIGNKTHPDSITFTVSATVDDGTGGRTPYAVKELKEADGTTDKVFTLSGTNDWRHEIEHLPVNTPDGKFIFYDIQEGHAHGYALTGIKDLTAEEYNYCNVDVVKLWPDSNGNHTEVLQVVLQNREGKYYNGVDANGNAQFVDTIADIDQDEIRFLSPENNYSQRYDRLPYLEGDDAYKAVQLHEDQYNHGLATYKRAIIQYELENSPLVEPVDPADKPNNPVIHKRIDALRDGVTNPDSDHDGEDLTDLYRLYLDYKVNSLQEPDGVDLLFVIDHSGSMNDSHWPGNEYRAPAVMAALNGENGFISEFLAANDKNQWAAVGFKGPDGFRDYEFSLTNPWRPITSGALVNAGENGSEVLSPSSGTSYEFTRSSGNIDLDNEDPLIQSNYTAGFWRAEQFLLKQNVKNDGRKKVVVFIADGVPTLHIDDLNDSLTDAGTAAGSPYYREEYGGCPVKALTEFGYFVNDLTDNGYVFGGDNGNIDFYTIGLGAMMQTEGSSDPDAPMSGSELLNRMLNAAYGQSVPASHFMTITDVTSSTDRSAANTLSKDLRIILGLNETFSNMVIQDDLSKYVDLYGLTAGSSASDIMTAAKAKVTMAVPVPDHPENPPQVITLYENGAPATSEDAKFTDRNGDKVSIIQELLYDENTKTVKAVFNPEFQPATDVTFTLSFDVKTTDIAYTTYAESGYDKYTEGDKQGQIITGDPDTDFLGTTPANATSSGKEGFRSNDEAKATYLHNSKKETLVYPHPVIQVAAKADIVKIDQNNAALEGAKFNLYNSDFDAGKTIEENAANLIEADLQSKKPVNPAGTDAVVRSGKLTPGIYYLVETKAPDGYNALPGPVKITVTEQAGTLYMSAEIAGVPVGSNKLVKINNGLWKLSVQNSAGYKLPSTGGPGTRAFTILGSILILGAGVLLLRRRRLI